MHIQGLGGGMASQTRKGGGNKRHRQGAKEVWYATMKDIKSVILHICIAAGTTYAIEGGGA
jgi:hypothetical protein